MTTTPRALTVVPGWIVLLQGLVSLLVGGIVLSNPATALVVLVRLLGWYWLIKGIFSLTAIFHPEARTHRGWLILNSLIGVIAGLAVLEHPLISAIFVPGVIVTLVGISGIFIGVNDLIASFRGAGWTMALLGVISIVLGGVILENQLIGIALLPLVIGWVEVVGGLVAVVMSFRLRSGQKQLA